MTPGLYPELSMRDYHAIDAASNSRLSILLDRSPAHLKAAMAAPDEDTTALRVGRAVHAAVLEPDTFAMTFTVAQRCTAEIASGANKGKQCQNDGVLFRAEAGGWLCGVHGKGLASDEDRVVLKPDEYAMCIGARDSVRSHAAASKILAMAGSRVEQSIVWTDKDTGVLCKGRLDIHAPDVSLIADLKTTTDASRRAFERSLFAFGYHRQGAHYITGCEALGIAQTNHYAIVAVEKEAPYAVAVYRLEDTAIEAGREQLRRALRIYADCLESGKWPAYDDAVVDITLPAWAWGQIDQPLIGESA